MFIFAQFKLADNLHEDEAFKYVKMRFHTVLGKKEEEIWSLKKIVKLVSISNDDVFENLL